MAAALGVLQNVLATSAVDVSERMFGSGSFWYMAFNICPIYTDNYILSRTYNRSFARDDLTEYIEAVCQEPCSCEYLVN